MGETHLHFDGSCDKNGLAALNKILQVRSISVHVMSPNFRTHSRDYGYQSRTYGDRAHRYETAFAGPESVALSGGGAATEAKAAISANFRGLWKRNGLRDELANICEKFASNGFWRDGWLTVKQFVLFRRERWNIGRMTLGCRD